MKFFGSIFGKYRKFSSERGYSCDCCGREIFSYPSPRLCEECSSALERNFRACDKCGGKTVAEGLCLDCKRKPPEFSCGFSPFCYRGKAAELINRMKNGERWLANYFGEQMSALWKRSGLCSDIVVFVPMTEAGERKRGYNQAAELAEKISEQTEIPVKSGLAKIRDTLPQKRLTKAERRENISGAYRAEGGFSGRKVLLVDDVMTTGATGSECAKALKRAGASDVFFLTAAAAPERA